MATASEADGPAAKRGRLQNNNRNPKQPLHFKDYAKHSDTEYSIDFERVVQGQGPLKFRLCQSMDREDDKQFVKVTVRCLDMDWRQFDDARTRVLVRVHGECFTANVFVDPEDGEMWGLPVFTGGFLSEEGCITDLLCSVEKFKYDVRWNRFREISTKPASYRDGSYRFVLQSEEGVEFFVHYLFLTDCSPLLKTHMDGNIDGVADGVPYKLACSTDTLWALLEWIYLRKIRDHFCGMIKVADSLQMWGVVHDVTKCMRKDLLNQPFECLFEFFYCAATYKLDGGKLEGEILKQLAVLSVDDQEKKDLLESQMKEYVKKNPKRVAAMAFESLYK